MNIAILGLPRSGTTWIGKIFDSVPTTLYFHEPDYAIRLPCVPYVAEVGEAEVWRAFIEQWEARVFSTASRRTVGKRPFFPKEYLGSASRRVFHTGWRARLLLAAAEERLVGSERIMELPVVLQSAPVRVWKSVESLGRLGVFAEVLNDTAFVHVVRHPCGFVDSVMRGDHGHHFQKSVTMSHDMGLMKWALSAPVASRFNLTLSELQRSAPEIRLAWFWLLMNLQAFEDGRTNDNYHLIDYD